MVDALSTPGKILFVDDDADVRRAAAMLLPRRGFVLFAAATPEEAWSVLAGETIDVILLDLNFARGATTGAEGLRFLEALLAHDPDCVVVVVTGHSGIAIAVAAMRAGAADFVMKPWNNDRLVATLTDAASLSRKRREARRAGAPPSGTPGEDPVIGESAALRTIRETMARVALTAASVLILGEAGTGKSLIARAVHRLSPRAAIPLATIDPAALWADGEAALSAALASAPEQGTIFLDEIAGLPAALQSLLIAFLETRPDLRTIAASRQPRQALSAGLVRHDLLYRLNTVEFYLPALRDRGDDARLLAAHFLRLFCRTYARPDLSLSQDAADAIAACPWLGNVRALRHAMERAVVLARDGVRIDDLHLAGSFADTAPRPAPGGDLNLARSEKAIVEAALQRHSFNVSHAAKELGLTRAALYRRMARHGL